MLKFDVIETAWLGDFGEINIGKLLKIYFFKKGEEKYHKNGVYKGFPLTFTKL